MGCCGCAPVSFLSFLIKRYLEPELDTIHDKIAAFKKAVSIQMLKMSKNRASNDLWFHITIWSIEIKSFQIYQNPAIKLFQNYRNPLEMASIPPFVSPSLNKAISLWAGNYIIQLHMKYGA